MRPQSACCETTRRLSEMGPTRPLSLSLQWASVHSSTVGTEDGWQLLTACASAVAAHVTLVTRWRGLLFPKDGEVL